MPGHIQNSASARKAFKRDVATELAERPLPKDPAMIKLDSSFANIIYDLNR